MHTDRKSQIFPEALTYDDVLLLPDYSEVLPRDTDTTVQLTENITLKVPLISAAMDTVTETELAVAMAREGGLGIIHKNMSIEAQAEQVRKVKRSESGMIIDPITMSEEAKIAEALQIMREHSIGGIPVINKEGKLTGIVTNRDLRFQKDPSRSIKEVMTSENLITAEEGTDLAAAEKILQEYRIEKLPIVDTGFMLKGLITYKDILKKKDFPNASKDERGRLHTGAAVGVTSDMYDRIEALTAAGVDLISIDTAHGHSKGVISAVKEVKQKYPYTALAAGNVATSEGAEALADAGADAVKVGVGPGSICTTRVIAGVGVPQLTAVLKASQALKSTKTKLIADGGIRFSGDIVKALAAGADTVMIGSLLAGTEEAPGEVVIFEGRKFKTYRGMGSLEAMEVGSKDRYFQQGEEDAKKLVPEGIVGRVPFKGKTGEVIFQLTGGLKAGMGYCGAPDIDTLRKAEFVKISPAGMLESHPHDIHITREAPNYSR